MYQAAGVGAGGGWQREGSRDQKQDRFPRRELQGRGVCGGMETALRIGSWGGERERQKRRREEKRLIGLDSVWGTGNPCAKSEGGRENEATAHGPRPTAHGIKGPQGGPS